VLTADNRFRFQRSVPGTYELTARATDAQNRESAPVVIAVTVRGSARPVNRKPELAMSPSGTVETKVGAAFELRASPSDPDGGTPTVRFTVDKPKEAPALPAALRESGGAQLLRFTPTVPGQYSFDFWATDAQGAQSERKTLELIVTQPSKPTAPAKPASELEAFLVDYAAAWEERDLDRLQAYWQIPTAEISRIDRAISASEAITAEVELMEGEVMTSGKAARIVFRERITGFGAGRSTDIQAGVYAATLMKDAEGWRIRFRQKR
jgi:hypothetical protein